MNGHHMLEFIPCVAFILMNIFYFNAVFSQTNRCPVHRCGLGPEYPRVRSSTTPSGKLFSILSLRRWVGLLMMEDGNGGCSTHVL